VAVEAADLVDLETAMEDPEGLEDSAAPRLGLLRTVLLARGTTTTAHARHTALLPDLPRRALSREPEEATGPATAPVRAAALALPHLGARDPLPVEAEVAAAVVVARPATTTTAAVSGARVEAATISTTTAGLEADRADRDSRGHRGEKTRAFLRAQKRLRRIGASVLFPFVGAAVCTLAHR
jgi:hypothetical protein